MSSGRFQIEELQHGAEIIPPLCPPQVYSLLGEKRHRAAHHWCSAMFWLMHTSVLFLFVLMTSMSLVGIWWLFPNTADASAFTWHFPPLPFPVLSDCCHNARLLTWGDCELQSRRDIFHQRYRKNRLDEGKASDKMSMCWDAVCFVDKAITYHPAWDSKKPLFISGAVYALYTYLTPCHLQMSPSGVYHGEVHPLIQTLSKLKILRTSAALHSLHEEGILWSKTMLKMYSFFFF